MRPANSLSTREAEAEGPGRASRRLESSGLAASQRCTRAPKPTSPLWCRGWWVGCRGRCRESGSGRGEDAQKHPAVETGPAVEVTPSSLSWRSCSAVGTPFQLSKGDTSLSGISSSPLGAQARGSWNGSHWLPGASLSGGRSRGAGSRGVVIALASPRREAPPVTAVNATPSDGPGPAPGRRALPARGGVCCFCSQREREREGYWRNSGL